MAEKIEVAKAFVTIVPSMEGSQAEITKELTGVTNEAADKAGAESGGKFGDKFASAIKGAGTAIAGAMAAATGAAVATGKAFLDSANDVAAYGDQVDKMSQKMGISATAYQEWDFVMQHAGASIDSLKSSMKTLATAAQTDSAAFEALGISQEQIASMSQEDLFAATISALQNVSSETERTYLAGQLLGKGATELGGLFNMSAEETEALKQQVHDLGGVMSDEAVKDAAAYQDAMQNMNVALDGVKKGMMSEFLPGITQVMTGLAGVFSGNGGIEEIQSGLESVIGKITEIAPQFFTLAQTLITSLISGFAPMLPQLVTSVFSVIIQAITTITSMIPQLMPSIISGIEGIMMALFQALPIIIEGANQLVLSLVTWLSSGDNITTFVNGLTQLVSQIANSVAVLLPVLLPMIIEIISQLALSLTDPNNVGTIVNAALTIIEAVVVALINALPQILELIVQLTANILEGTIVFLGTLLTKLGEWIVTAVGKVGEFGQNILNKLRELPGKVIEIGQNLIKGIWEGIQNMGQWIKDKIASFGQTITDGFKAVFGIASPSKLFADVIGKNLALGIAEGFDDEVGDVEKDMAKSMDGLTGSMTASVTAYGSQSSAMLGNNTTYNGGNITINVYGEEGQSVNELAQVIADKLEAMTRRRSAVYE